MVDERISLLSELIVEYPRDIIRSRTTPFILIGGLWLISLLLQLRSADVQFDRLHDLREWLSAKKGNAEELLGIREVLHTSTTRGNGALKLYLFTPCRSLCNERLDCKPKCQSLINDLDEFPSDTKMLVETWNEQGTVEGRGVINLVGFTSVVRWKKKSLTLLHRSGQYCCNELLILELKSDQWVMLDQLNLGPFTDVSFQDLDGDERKELIAPDPRFAQLTPEPLYVKMVYQITDKGLQRSPELIELPAPKSERKWIIEHRKHQDNPDELREYFEMMIGYCLRGDCAIADELVYLTYPQNESLLYYWESLKSKL